MFRNYVLGADGEPIHEPDLLRFCLWEATADHQIADVRRGGVRVSTVFLAQDHNRAANQNPNLPPLLFETMILGGDHDGYQRRYGTRAEAVAGHREACALAGLAADEP